MKEICNDELKKVLLDILIEFDEFCRRHNLRYSLCYGTALGAVRHNGFIPWDDDIDIMMPRRDYKKLQRIFEKKDLAFYTQETHQPYAYTFGKIVNTKTLLYEHRVKKKYELGVYIDVFPVDAYPKEQEKEIWKMYHRYKRDLVYYTIGFSKGRNIINTIGKNSLILYTEICMLMRKMSPLKLVTELENRLEYYSQSTGEKHMKVIAGGEEREFEFKECDFNTLVPIEFEGHIFMIIRDYDNYLKCIYGDYMNLPPKCEQVSKHSFEAYWL